MDSDSPSALGRTWRVGLGVLVLAGVGLALLGVVRPATPSGPTESTWVLAIGILVLVGLAGTFGFRRQRRDSLVPFGIGDRGRTSHRRRVVLALGLIGGSSVLLWLLVDRPGVELLLYVAGVALFGLVVSYVVLPGRTLPPVVADGLYEALASRPLPGDLRADAPVSGLYLPASRGAADSPLVRPFDGTRAAPDPESLEAGDLYRPTGAALYEPFRSRASPVSAPSREALGWQLCRAITDWFALAERATPSVDESGVVSVLVEGCTLADECGFDHPVPSFLGVALAAESDEPVLATVEPVETEAGDYRITCRVVKERSIGNGTIERDLLRN